MPTAPLEGEVEAVRDLLLRLQSEQSQLEQIFLQELAGHADLLQKAIYKKGGPMLLSLPLRLREADQPYGFHMAHLTGYMAAAARSDTPDLEGDAGCPMAERMEEILGVNIHHVLLLSRPLGRR